MLGTEILVLVGMEILVLLATEIWVFLTTEAWFCLHDNPALIKNLTHARGRLGTQQDGAPNSDMFRSTTKGPPGETKLGPQILSLVARLTRFWRPDIVARTGERAAGCGLAGGWTGRPGLCYRDRGRWHTDKRILRRHTHANIRQTHLIQPHGLKLQKNGHKKEHDEEDDERHPLTIGINARDDNTRGTRRKHTTAKENTGGKTRNT